MRTRQCRTGNGHTALCQDNLVNNVATENSRTGKTISQDILVEIFISEHCFVCEYAQEVAATIRRDFPAVTLHIIDIHNTEELIPEQVFATPTYLLNGKVWSLGNPSPQKVTETLSELVAVA